MSIKFLGNDVPIERIETGFWSFDNACRNQAGERGFAIPAFVELYAEEGVGKTAFAVSMAGLLAKKLEKNIAFLDWEIQDFKTIISILERQGFSGELHKILEKKDEESIDKFYSVMEKEDYGVGIMDSIGAFTSIAEQQGKQADAIMGKAAWNMSKFSRTVVRNLQQRKSPAAVLCTNHMHPNIGFMQSGQDTSGGKKKKYLSTYRIWLKKLYWNKRTQNLPPISGADPIGWVLEGRFDKNRTGFAMTKFHVAMIMGEGLHLGLSALYDCLINGYAELSRNRVIMEEQDLGHIKMFIKKRHDDDRFAIFYNTLKGATITEDASDDDNEDDVEDGDEE